MAEKNGTAVKTTKAPKADKAPVERKRKDGLRVPQVRILEALAKGKGTALSRRRLSERAAVDIAWIADYVGKTDPKEREAREEVIKYPSMLTLGYVKTKELDVDGKTERVYEITDKGRKALEKAKEAAKAEKSAK